MLLFAAPRKTRGIEHIGTIPQLAMAVQDVWRYDDQGSRPHIEGAQLIGLFGRSAQRRDWGVQPQCLDNRLGHHQSIDYTSAVAFQLASGLLPHLITPIRRLRQQEERPGQRICRGFMSGREEGEDVRPYFGQADRPSRGGIERAQ
jgi:hypothetical protein